MSSLKYHIVSLKYQCLEWHSGRLKNLVKLDSVLPLFLPCPFYRFENVTGKFTEKVFGKTDLPRNIISFNVNFDKQILLLIILLFQSSLLTDENNTYC